MFSVPAKFNATGLDLYRAQFYPHVAEKGLRDWKNGEVLGLHVAGGKEVTVSAAVGAGKPVRCTLTRHANAWSGTCSCVMRSLCPHLYATALALEMRGGSPPLEPPKPKKTFRETWTPEIEQALGRPLREDEGRVLGRLSGLFARLQQARGELGAYEYLQFGFSSPESERGPYTHPFEGWWADRHPADPWELWQYIAYDLEQAGRPIPEVLRPKTDTAPIRQTVDRLMLESQKRSWAQKLSVLKREDPEVLVGKSWRQKVEGLRLRLTPEGWRLEVRAGGGAFKSAGPKLLREMMRAEALDFAHLPAAEASLATTLLTFDHDMGPMGKEPPFGLVRTVFALGQAAGAVVGPEGGAWRVEPEKLEWRVVADPRDESRMIFELAEADGAAVPAVFATAEPELLYVLGGQVYRGPRQMPEMAIPRAVIADRRIAGELERIGVRLPPEIPASLRRVAMSPRVECWLEPGAALSSTRLFLRLLARAEEPACEQSWTGQGWRWTARPGAAKDSGVIDFDLTAANAVGAFFWEVAPQWDAQVQAWTGLVARSFPDDLIAWRNRLPAGTAVAADPKLAGLFEAPLKARYVVNAARTAANVDWFDVSVQLTPDDVTLTAEEIEVLRAARGRFVSLPQRGWRRLAVEGEEEAQAALARIGLDGPMTGEATRFHALQLADEGLKAVLPEGIWRDASRRAAELQATPKPAMPEGLAAHLRPYQEEGFHFLAFLAENGFGGVLADDMGLGKTVQALTWLLWLKQRHKAERAFRALVVGPKSVTVNWQLEAGRFAPELKVAALGPRAGQSPVPDAEVVVGNYTQLRLHQKVLCAEHWDAVILDEGQNIKNPSSATAKAARALGATHRAVLTGTPIENRLLDLWSLFAFAQPGLLGSQAGFLRSYSDKSDEGGAQARLSARVRHFLLRRTKGQVAADLPARTEEEILCELEGTQATLYQAELKRARQTVMGIESAADFDRERFHVLTSLLRLRQICCDPRLVSGPAPDAEGASPSAKLEALFDTLEPLAAEGHKVLVFSQFVGMLEIIASELKRRNIDYVMLTGQTEDRQAMVDRFQSDPALPVFLLSLKAGGSGLNLTAASYVVLYDPWWNPAVEAQAIDRTHRIGQKSQVVAYRLIARGTVEEKIRAMQKEKAALAAAVVREETLAQVMDLETLRRILE